MDQDSESPLVMPSDEYELTEDDLEEVEYLKQKITDIVERKEQPPI